MVLDMSVCSTYQRREINLMGRDIYRYRIMWGTLRGMWQFQHNKKYEEDEEEGATESLMS